MPNLTLYLCQEAELPKDKNYIKFNDAYFNKYYTDYKIDDTAKNIIKSIDEVEYTGNYRFKSKFEKEEAHIKLTELSTGCKTALNVYFNPDKIFTVAECGNNAFEEILKLNSGNAHLPYAKTAVKLEHTIRVYTTSTGINQVSTKSELRKALASYFKER